MKTLKDAENNLTTYVYDGHDRLSQAQYPSAAKGAATSNTNDFEQLTYENTASNTRTSATVASRRNRANQTTSFSYDNLGRVTLKNLPAGEQDVSYGYDNLGRLTSASRTGIALSFTYDALSRQLTEVGPLGTVASEYDIAGRRTKLTYPGSGLYVEHDYLVTGEVEKIRENGATSGVGVLAAYAYDALGNRTSLTFGNGVVQAFGFDPVSRLQSLTNNLSGTANDLSASFAYNPASQIKSVTRDNDAYALTPIANVSKSGTANGLNQLTQYGSQSLSHDTKGNVTAFGTKSFTYSSENLLVTGPNSTSLVYDPLLRLVQVTSGAATKLAYDGLDRIAEYNASNVLQRRYVHGPGMDEPIVWYEGSGTADRRFLSADERGSIVAVSDSSGALLGINKYDEYGVPASGNLGLFGYTGQAWLPSLGEWYYKARVYDPELGRFLQTDPIGYGDSPNLYAYVGNDPVNLVDPLGLVDEAVIDPQAPIFVTGEKLTPLSSRIILLRGGGGFPGEETEGVEPGEVPAPNEPKSDKCEFAPLSDSDRKRLSAILSNPFVVAGLHSAWQNTVRTGNEWSFFVYPGSGPSIANPFGNFTVGPLWEGTPRSGNRRQDTEFRLSRVSPVANVHTHPGTYPNAQFPSGRDSNYNKYTGTIGIVLTHSGIKSGRECK